jgi:hypothetical protein
MRLCSFALEREVEGSIHVVGVARFYASMQEGSMSAIVCGVVCLKVFRRRCVVG